MPTVGKSVQFRGINNAVNAYSNMEIPRWGLFQGSQFLMKYSGTNMKEGAQLLEDYLNALDLRSADTNTYTLCIYDSADKITSASKYDASFNFRLVDNIDGYRENKISGSLEMRIAGMEQKLNEVLTPAEDEPEELSPMQQIVTTLGKILEHPQIQQVLATKLVGIIDGVSNTVSGLFSAQPLPVAAIGTVQPVPVPGSENQKLQEALNILADIDPMLGSHLLQLAVVAKSDPEKYNSLIGMLKLL